MSGDGVQQREHGVPRVEVVVRLPFERAADTAVRNRGGGAGVGLRHAVGFHQRIGHLGRRQASKAKPLAAGADRGKQQLGGRGDEHERGRVRRLLERLQQRVLRVRNDPLRIVDDDDAAPSFEWTVGGALDRVADLLDLDGAGLTWLDEQHVGVNATRDPPAGGARSAGVLVDRRDTVDELCEGQRRRTFADSGRTGKDQARWERAARRRPRNEALQPFVANKVPEGHRVIITMLNDE